jgi:hypothetical protein
MYIIKRRKIKAISKIDRARTMLALEEKRRRRRRKTSNMPAVSFPEFPRGRLCSLYPSGRSVVPNFRFEVRLARGEKSPEAGVCLCLSEDEEEKSCRARAPKINLASTALVEGK